MNTKKKVSIKDVANACGVSTATISRAFKEGTEINENTRQFIIQKSKELGYVPNPSAQSLRLQRGNCIGLILPVIKNHLYWNFIQLLENKLREQNLTLLIHFMSENTAECETEALFAMYHSNVEATIFIPIKSEEKSPFIQRHGKNVRLIQAFHDIYPEFASVRINDSHGIREASEYLIQNGHENILFLGTRSRLNTYKKVLEEYHLPFDQNLIRTDIDNIDLNEIKHMIERHHPSAILAVANAAEKTLWTLLKQGYNIPNDISFLAYDDVEWVSTFNITAVSHPLDKLVDEIVSIVTEQIQSSDYEIATPRHISISPTLVIRDSVKNIK